MKRKGISPLITTVLVLAVAISAASIFAGWGPDLVQTITQETTDQTQDAIDCNAAGLEMRSASWNDTGDGEVAVVLRNTGDNELTDVFISAWDETQPIAQDSNLTVSMGELENFTLGDSEFEGTPEQPEEVEAFSEECADVSDSTTNIDPVE